MRHFHITELVDKATYENLAERSILMLNPILTNAIDELRDYLNTPIVVNNWNTGGNLQYRGFRPSYCEIGATYSQHRLGNAIDFHCPRLPITDLKHWISTHSGLLYALGFRAVEDFSFTKTWIHLDVRPITLKSQKLQVIKP